MRRPPISGSMFGCGARPLWRLTTEVTGGSRFVDVEVEQVPAAFAENVPPLLLSAPLPAEFVVFVTTPDDLRDTQPHPAPRRQIVVVLDGELEIETSDGNAGAPARRCGACRGHGRARAHDTPVEGSSDLRRRAPVGVARVPELPVCSVCTIRVSDRLRSTTSVVTTPRTRPTRRAVVDTAECGGGRPPPERRETAVVGTRGGISTLCRPGGLFGPRHTRHGTGCRGRRNLQFPVQVRWQSVRNYQNDRPGRTTQKSVPGSQTCAG